MTSQPSALPGSPREHLSSPVTRSVLTIQRGMLTATREFLTGRGFMEVLPPVIGPVTDPGARGAKQVDVDYYGHRYKLMTSAILYKQASLTAFDKIFCIAPNVRLEPLETASTDRHLAEFHQIDVEAADTSRGEIMRLVEELVGHVVERVVTALPEEFERLGRDVGALAGLRAGPFDRQVTLDVVAELRDLGHDQSPDAEIDWVGEAMVSRKAAQPFFITDYPKGSRGFYDRENLERPGFLRNFDLIAPEGYGELCSGSERENDYATVITRMRETGENPAKYGWYLADDAGGNAVQRGFRPRPGAVHAVRRGSRLGVAGQCLSEGAGGGVTLNGPTADGFPDAVCERARSGVAAAFPDPDDYGHTLFGADPNSPTADRIDAYRLVPPVFVPRRLATLIDLAREPGPSDVELETMVGGFRSTLPLYVSAFGSTAAGVDLGAAAASQAGRLGIPLVIGENVMPVNGYGRIDEGVEESLLHRITAYRKDVVDGYGGVVVQQSTEDADSEVWNVVYSDPNVRPLLESGRLAFELKVGQGAKPGLGGMTLVDRATAARLAEAFTLGPALGDRVVRCASAGTFTDEILRQQIRLMRNNYPRARVWVKLPPARDVRDAALLAWGAGADAITVDGAEGGTGWAPRAFLDHVGLPLAECLRRIGDHPSCLLVSGRMWEGARVAKCLALGAGAAGLGRAALLAAATDAEHGLVNLVDCLALELRMLTSAIGKYHVGELSREDVWCPT